MAFRTDDKDGRRLPMNCPRWWQHLNNTDTRSKVYGYAKLDTHTGSVFLQTFQSAEVDYSENHKFRWGARNVYKVSLKSSWTKVQTLIFQFVRPDSPKCEPWKAMALWVTWNQGDTKTRSLSHTVCCVIISTKFLWLLSEQTTTTTTKNLNTN